MSLLPSSKDASTHLADWAELIQAIIDEFRARREWISDSWADSDAVKRQGLEFRLLDYACGSGTVSKVSGYLFMARNLDEIFSTTQLVFIKLTEYLQALLPFVTQAVGLDISPGMVSEYNKWAQETGSSSDRVWAYEYDMLAGEERNPLPRQDLSNFDIVVVSMALHHVSDPAKLMQRLGQCLRPGGTCVILDRTPASTKANTDATTSKRLGDTLKTVNKEGFAEEEMQKLYEDAGMGQNFEYVVIPRPFEARVFGRELSITGFIARGELA